MNSNDGEVAELANDLVLSIARFRSVAVAFSGGVDSAVVAAAALKAIQGKAIAITGIGSAVASSELDSARSVAASIGIRHIELLTGEIDDANYVRNDAKRCYFCKSNLYQTLQTWANENGIERVLSGTNLDDLGDYRPGLQAAAEHFVVAPLAELKIDKQMVRRLARYFELAVADKPASPCLASRIAYGQSVTSERLRSIESAESFLTSLGFSDVRVRLHGDALARIELSLADLGRACETTVRNAINARMQELGFKFVTLDLMGRQSGSLNRTLPILVV
ncbi:MAG: ATP-dependent sacrificial sulfur transferase LarE [Planctomycetota bacterium]|nr:ATP-dependent sacrificial sulfur transferase LarE [Planctomycetota bacterium]